MSFDQRFPYRRPYFRTGRLTWWWWWWWWIGKCPLGSPRTFVSWIELFWAQKNDAKKKILLDDNYLWGRRTQLWCLWCVALSGNTKSITYHTFTVRVLFILLFRLVLFEVCRIIELMKENWKQTKRERNVAVWCKFDAIIPNDVHTYSLLFLYLLQEKWSTMFT